MVDDSADDTAAFLEYLHRKLLTANFLPYDIESAKKKCIYWICILKQYISCSKTMYLIKPKMAKHFGANQIFPQQIITCHFSYHSLLALALIS